MASEFTFSTRRARRPRAAPTLSDRFNSGVKCVCLKFESGRPDVARSTVHEKRVLPPRSF